VGMFPAVAVNVVPVAPAATVTDVPGTGSSALLLDSATTVPPAGAAPLSVTVQLVLPELDTVVGAQAKEVTVGPGPPPSPITIPPVADTAMALPETDAAPPLLIPMVVLITAAAIVRFTTATVPLAIILAFSPEATQVYAPETAAQFNTLAALVAAAPAAAEIERTLLGGYVSVH